MVLLFSRHFKKILNGQKLDNLFSFNLPKFGGDLSKTVIHFFRFLRVLEKQSNDARSGNYSNIYHSNYKGHQRLLIPNRASLLFSLFK